MARGAPSAATTPLPPGELDALVAPVAIYPDDLLAQVLMASTYPLEVVAASHFLEENPTLTGPALDEALRDKQWDPSVLSLTAFPQVMKTMSDKVEWMQQLGDAFLSNPQQVMDAVQDMRRRAEAAGNLQSSPQQYVTDENGTIVVQPATPPYVYVPEFDPNQIYGSWSDAGDAAPYWPVPLYGYPTFVGVVFRTACVVSPNHWGWAHPNWRAHAIDVRGNGSAFVAWARYRNVGPGGHWAYLPEHRHAVTVGSGAVPAMATGVPRDTASERASPRAAQAAALAQWQSRQPVPPAQASLTRTAPMPVPQQVARPTPPVAPSYTVQRPRPTPVPAQPVPGWIATPRVPTAQAAQPGWVATPRLPPAAPQSAYVAYPQAYAPSPRRAPQAAPQAYAPPARVPVQLAANRVETTGGSSAALVRQQTPHP